MRRIGWVAALATVAGWSFPALAWDTLTTDSAVACESLFRVKEADKAAQAGDDAWLKSLGCVRVPGGLTATMIERPRNATNYRAQLRLHDANATAWTGVFQRAKLTLFGGSMRPKLTPLHSPGYGALFNEMASW